MKVRVVRVEVLDGWRYGCVAWKDGWSNGRMLEVVGRASIVECTKQRRPRPSAAGEEAAALDPDEYSVAPQKHQQEDSFPRRMLLRRIPDHASCKDFLVAPGGESKTAFYETCSLAIHSSCSAAVSETVDDSFKGET